LWLDVHVTTVVIDVCPVYISSPSLSGLRFTSYSGASLGRSSPLVSAPPLWPFVAAAGLLTGTSLVAVRRRWFPHRHFGRSPPPLVSSQALGPFVAYASLFTSTHTPVPFASVPPLVLRFPFLQHSVYSAPSPGGWLWNLWPSASFVFLHRHLAVRRRWSPHRHFGHSSTPLVSSQALGPFVACASPFIYTHALVPFFHVVVM
jgi:hypothetical protein